MLILTLDFRYHYDECPWLRLSLDEGELRHQGSLRWFFSPVTFSVDDTLSTASAMRRALGRLSYGSFTTDNWANAERRLSRTYAEEVPNIPIPSVIPQTGDTESTPLPMLSITVLSIVSFF